MFLGDFPFVFRLILGGKWQMVMMQQPQMVVMQPQPVMMQMRAIEMER